MFKGSEKLDKNRGEVMKSVFKTIEDCCGCTACFNICPSKAITLEGDREGFLYPRIESSRCTDCGVCLKVCPVINEKSFKNLRDDDFYLAKHKSEEVLRSSTSGGAFTAISDIFLREGGLVCGVDFDQRFRVVHRISHTAEGRDRFRFSKYVQSELGDIFVRIKKELKAGKKVLFTGTPCQCGGLKGFMGEGELTKDLYLGDIICHSIPSPLIWEEFKKVLEKENGGTLDRVHFRTKRLPWSRDNSNKAFLFSTTEMDDLQGDERFYKMFFGISTISRPSCSACRFTDTHRVSDITIADYFGIEEFSPEKYDKLGLSLIMVNSDKGDKLLKEIGDDMDLEKRESSESIKHQQRLREPMVFPEDRSQFWKDLERMGLQETMIKYGVFK